MSTRVAWVDFDRCVAHVVVDASSPLTSSGPTCELVSVLHVCGIRDIAVWLESGTEAAAGAALRAMGALVHFERYPHRQAPAGNVLVQDARTSGRIGVGSGGAYHACFETLARAVGWSTTAVAVVRAAADIHPSLAGRLRFAVHELVSNTVDHAVFTNSTPRIEITLSVTSSTVLLMYRDNARAFRTDQPPCVDLAEKIARGERRGLGLFMLNQMAPELRYRRRGEWNETTILFVATNNTPPTRRSVMGELRLEQTPCQIPNTVIIKPVGSIDATTVHLMDAKLTALASQAGATVVIDMSMVEAISSAGLGVFLGTVSQLRAQGGDLVFAAMPPTILQIFEIINLAAYFRMLRSIDDLEAVHRG